MAKPQSLTARNGDRIAVVTGLRTPFVKQATVFHGVPALDLGKMVINEMLTRNDIDPKIIQQVVFGQVVQMPEAPNIAREIVLGTGMDIATDAYTVSRACASSFQAISNITESIMAGTIDCGIAGGADSFSVVPIGVSKKLAHQLVNLTKAKTTGDKLNILRQLSLKDLLPVSPSVAEYSTGLTMGQTAEQMAKSYNISRQAQDELAHRSHTLAAKAWEEGKLTDEVMTAYPEPMRAFISEDNNIRKNSTIESYAKLRPAFDRKHGSVTAANSTPLTDGAGAVLLMSESRAKELGLEVLGYIRSHAYAGVRADIDGLIGPSYAVPMALDRAGITFNDLTLFDMHEAFSAQTLANLQCIESDLFAQQKLGRGERIGNIDDSKFNVLGGSIAYGHPFAATGARMITQTLRELNRRGGGLGLTTACAAGGLGVAMIVESV